MHEESIANAILNQVREHIAALSNDANTNPTANHRVASITVSCGEFSGVDSALLSLSLVRLCTTRSEFTGCECHVNSVPVTVRCNACHCEFALVNFTFQCACGSRSLAITSGDGLILESFTLTNDSTPPT